MGPIGADGLVIEGYQACSCGAWVPDDRLPVCDECRSALNARSQAARLRYEVAGRPFTAPKPKGKAKRKPKRRHDNSAGTARAADRAKMRAYVRLSHIYDAMYRTILDEERIAEGLEPLTTRGPRPTTLAATLAEDLDAAEADLQARLAAGA